MTHDASESAPVRTVGRCRMHAPIAQGGMATVYLGRWLGAGGFARTVAIKAMHPHYARDGEFARMFRDEARVVSRVKHPNVLATLDLIDEGGELFLVMEYVHGVTLAQLLRHTKRRGEEIPIGIALRIVTSVLHGLQAAHEATDENGRRLGVVHRDVTPENILVGADGSARLIDFGIARAKGRATTTQTGQLKGKPSYLAPEQLLEQPLDAQTDVYSAAAVLWQTLVGRKLFVSDDLAALCCRILDNDVPPPSKLRKGVTHELDAIVLRGLVRDRISRWRTADDMAAAIERLGQLATHRQVGAWVRTVASERLAQLARAVADMESVPLAEEAAPIEAPVSSAPEVTDLNSERTAARRERVHLGGVGAAIALAFVVGLGVRSMTDAPIPQAADAGMTAAILARSPLGAMPVAPEREPPTSTPSAPPPASASAQHSPPPPAHPPRSYWTPKRWVPSGI